MKLLIKNGRELLVSESGEVFLNGNKMKQYIDKDGYLLVSVYNKGASKMLRVHRLVAEAYLPNPNNKLQVNHINSIKNDNRVENLEWATQSENLKHSYLYGGRISPMLGMKGKVTARSKSILQVSLDGFIVNEFDSATQASIATGLWRQDICKVRSGTKKSTGGYIWI